MMFSGDCEVKLLSRFVCVTVVLHKVAAIIIIDCNNCNWL